MRSAFRSATAWWIAEFEGVGVDEGLMGEVMRLEVAPDDFDVVEFGRIPGQPLDGEPMRARGERLSRKLAGMDRSIVFDQHYGFGGLARLGAKEAIECSR